MQQLLTGKRRLKGFSGEWKTVKLGDVCEICSSKRVLKKDWKSEGVPFYRTREIINLSNNDEFKSPIYISDELYIKLKEKYGIPKAGDILVTGVGSIGKTYITKNTDKFYFKDGNVLWIKVSNNINSNYLNQLFKTRFIKKQLFDNASITTVATFTIEGARKTYIKNPCFQEQTAIAKILATADDEITALGKKKQILENQKKYLLNNLITGQIRTPENLTISK